LIIDSDTVPRSDVYVQCGSRGRQRSNSKSRFSRSAHVRLHGDGSSHHSLGGGASLSDDDDVRLFVCLSVCQFVCRHVQLIHVPIMACKITTKPVNVKI